MDTAWADDVAVLLSAPSRGLRVAEVHDGLVVNSYRGRAWPRTRPRLPYAVHLADSDGEFWTLGLDVDCDDPRRREEQVRALGAQLDAAGICWVGAVSGPGGHRHLWATLTQPVPSGDMATVAHALKTLVPDLDIGLLLNPRTGALRPPGSPHRAGGRSVVVGDPGRARAILRERNSAQAWAPLLAWAQSVTVEPEATTADVSRVLAALPTSGGIPYLPGTRRDLNPEVTGRLRRGPVDAGTADRSATAAALTASVVQAHWQFPDYWALVADPSHRGLDHLRAERAGKMFRPRRDVRGAAQRMWVRALRWVLANPAVRRVDPAGQAQVVALAAAVRGATWGGQGGPRERAVMDALLAVAVRRSDPRVSASVRWLSQVAGPSPSACHRAVKRLVGRGWLIPVEEQGQPTVATHAGTYRLQIPQQLPAPCPPDMNVPGGTPVLAPQVTALASRSHDAPSRAGLGLLAGWVLDELTREPTDDHGLCTRLGLRLRTVRPHRTRLLEAGLLHADGAGRWHRTDRPLEQVAADLGVTGVTARRAAHHQHERETFSWWLADQASWPTPGRPRSAAPAAAFPRDSTGRRCWPVALRLVEDGLGLREDERDRIGADGGLIPAARTGTVTAEGRVGRAQHQQGVAGITLGSRPSRSAPQVRAARVTPGPGFCLPPRHDHGARGKPGRKDVPGHRPEEVRGQLTLKSAGPPTGSGVGHDRLPPQQRGPPAPKKLAAADPAGGHTS